MWLKFGKWWGHRGRTNILRGDIPISIEHYPHVSHLAWNAIDLASIANCDHSSNYFSPKSNAILEYPLHLNTPPIRLQKFRPIVLQTIIFDQSLPSWRSQCDSNGLSEYGLKSHLDQLRICFRLKKRCWWMGLSQDCRVHIRQNGIRQVSGRRSELE